MAGFDDRISDVIVGSGAGQHPQQLGGFSGGERAGAGADQLLGTQLPGGRGLHPAGLVQHQLGAAIDGGAGEQRADTEASTLGEDRRQPPRLLQRDAVGDQHQRGQGIVGVLAAVGGEVRGVIGLQQPGTMHQLGLQHIQRPRQAGRAAQPREATGAGDEPLADQQHLHRGRVAGGQQPNQAGASQAVGTSSGDGDGAEAGQVDGNLIAVLLGDGDPGRGGIAGIPRWARDTRPRRRLCGLLPGGIGGRVGGAGGGKGQQPGGLPHPPASSPLGWGGGPQRPAAPAAS